MGGFCSIRTEGEGEVVESFEEALHASGGSKRTVGEVARVEGMNFSADYRSSLPNKGVVSSFTRLYIQDAEVRGPYKVG